MAYIFKKYLLFYLVMFLFLLGNPLCYNIYYLPLL